MSISQHNHDSSSKTISIIATITVFDAFALQEDFSWKPNLPVFVNEPFRFASTSQKEKLYLKLKKPIWINMKYTTQTFSFFRTKTLTLKSHIHQPIVIITLCRLIDYSRLLNRVVHWTFTLIFLCNFFNLPCLWMILLVQPLLDWMVYCILTWLVVYFCLVVCFCCLFDGLLRIFGLEI